MELYNYVLVLYLTSFIDLNLEIHDPNILPALLLKSFILILRSMFSLKNYVQVIPPYFKIKCCFI